MPKKAAVTLVVEPSTAPITQTKRARTAEQHRASLLTKAKPRTKEVLARSAQSRAAGRVKKLAPYAKTAKTMFEAGIVNPACARGLRFKDEVGTFPTSAITLHTVLPILQATGNKGTYGALVPGGQFNAYLFRDLLRSLVYFDANVGTKTYSYTASFYQNSAIVTTLILDAEASEEQAIDLLWLTDTYPLNNATYFHPHGPVLYPGTSSLAGGRKFVWLDTGASFVATQTAAHAASLNVYAWSGSDADLNGAPVAFAGGVATYVATVQGYFAFAYLDPVAEANSLTAIVTGTGDVFAHLTAPNIEGQLVNLTSARVLANSLLLSDTSSAMNVEGSVHAAQFPANIQWFDTLTPTAVDSNTLHFSGRAATGVYGWLKPTSKSDFEYPKTISARNGVLSAASFPLDAGTEFAVFVVSTAGLAVGSYPALDFLLTQSMAIEFITQSQWYETELPGLQSIDRIICMDKLSVIDQFMENPTHLETLWNSIKGTAGFFKKHASTISGALSTMFPQYGAVFGAARMMSRVL
jgi:hypothetical protein